MSHKITQRSEYKVGPYTIAPKDANFKKLLEQFEANSKIKAAGRRERAIAVLLGEQQPSKMITEWTTKEIIDDTFGERSFTQSFLHTYAIPANNIKQFRPPWNVRLKEYIIDFLTKGHQL